MPCIFSQRKKPGRQTAPMSLLSVEPRFFRQFNEISIYYDLFIEPYALFYFLYAEGLIVLNEYVDFPIPNRSYELNQFFLLRL